MGAFGRCGGHRRVRRGLIGHYFGDVVRRLDI